MLFLSIAVVLVTLAVNVESNCNTGWVTLGVEPKGCGDSCYYFNDNDKTFRKAREWCEERGAMLVRIETALENQLIYEYMTDTLGWGGNAYIGLHINPPHHNFSWSNTPEIEEDWNDLFWALGEPDPIHQHENCTQITTGQEGLWNDIPCSKTIKFICEMPGEDGVDCDEAYGPKWISPDLNISKSCYLFTWGHGRTWRRALKQCRKHNGTDFAVIETYKENQMLWGLMKDIREQRWIAMKVNHTAPGVYYEYWVTGSNATYRNFVPGEPNNWNGREKCVQMRRANGQWNDQPCSKTMRAICENYPPHCPPDVTMVPPQNGPPTEPIFVPGGGK